MDTELKLRQWRTGSTQAERLCADILVLQGFDDVDPQAPLGGPDDKKDILCSKAGIEYVAGVYFPPMEKAFSDVQAKFAGDLAGVARHERDGFIFFTNQHLTLGERETLMGEALKTCRDCQIFHLERIRTILDQPTGYGIRLTYLGTELSIEEQFAYFTHARGDVERQIERQGRMLGAISAKIDQLLTGQEFVIQTMAMNGQSDDFAISPPPSRPDLFLGGVFRAKPDAHGFSAVPSFAQLLALHRAICFDAPSNAVGRLRDIKVWLARPGEPSDQVVAVPPDPAEVPARLGALFAEWADGFAELSRADSEAQLRAVAKFHADFLRIHPLLDGNGRVARFMMMQQCLDLFGVADMSVMDKGADYFAALHNADNGDLAPLVKLLRPVAGIEQE